MIQKKPYPLLTKYFLISASIFACSVVLGIFISSLTMRRMHLTTAMDELVKSCRVIRGIKADGGLSDIGSVQKFIQINPEYLDTNASLWSADGKRLFALPNAPKVAGAPPSEVPKELCQPAVLPGHEMAAIRISADAILIASLRPSRLELLAYNENSSQPYRIFRRHPIIFGYRPEQFMAIILIVFFILGFIASGVTAYLLFRRISIKAGKTLEELKNGNLKARFLIDGRTPSGVGGKFNEMADEIEKLVNHLRTVEKSRSALLQELAHDLKTPVASLQGLLETLRDFGEEMPPEKRIDFLNNSISETYYFSRLVADLLFISGVVHPHFKNETRRLDLMTLIRGETALFEKEEGLSIEISGPASAEISGEELLLKRLMRNAIDNAVAFATSKIVIHVSLENPDWRILVVDDGKGISSEAQKTFGLKRSSRAAGADQTGRISIGLGSVIMRKIAQLYGGDVQIETGALPFFDHGTTLTIRLRA